MNSFTLHPRLGNDSLLISKLKLSQCRLMNNTCFPWLILIPEIPDAIELVDLSFAEQAIILQEINQAATSLRHIFPCDKLNIATLGNQVSQLHIHIIARTQTDCAWPNPVWGVKAEAYEDAKKDQLIVLLRQSLQDYSAII